MATSSKLRQHLAQEAARILADQGDHDFERARRKAADHLRCRDRHQFPSNAEIEQALRDYQQLYFGPEHDANLHRLRTLALEAMEAMQEFSPRLVGPVLSGTADQFSAIELHLFSDTPEQITFYLIDRKIPWREGEKTVRYPDGSSSRQPVFCFQADETEMELVWFATEKLRQPILGPLDNGKEERASASHLRQLMAISGP
jgi:hypothetical protein